MATNPGRQSAGAVKKYFKQAGFDTSVDGQFTIGHPLGSLRINLLALSRDLGWNLPKARLDSNVVPEALGFTPEIRPGLLTTLQTQLPSDHGISDPADLVMTRVDKADIDGSAQAQVVRTIAHLSHWGARFPDLAGLSAEMRRTYAFQLDGHPGAMDPWQLGSWAVVEARTGNIDFARTIFSDWVSAFSGPRGLEFQTWSDAVNAYLQRS